MDHVFTIRLLEQASTGTSANASRVRVRYVNRRREYYVESVDNAFELVRRLLATSQGEHSDQD
jgi:hypothetical protein